MEQHPHLKKSQIKDISPPSEAALHAFDSLFPKIISFVNEKYALEMRFLEKEVTAEQMRMLKDAHKRFGEFLFAVYEFHLYDNLLDEFSWYISVFSCRGFKQNYFDTIIKTWNIAIHSVIPPPESHELTRPLEWMHQNLSLVFGRCINIETPASDELQKLLGFLTAKKRKESTDYIFSLLKESSIEKIYSNLLPSAMNEIGRLWQQNKMSVVDVHIATDICRYITMRLADSTTITSHLPYKALVTCVPGEEHEMGAEITENYLELKGWNIYSMGHIAPMEDTINTIVTNSPDLVFLSVTLVANLPAAKTLINKIRESLPSARITMGGHAAMLAREKLKDYADIIVDNIEEAHAYSLKLVDAHA